MPICFWNLCHCPDAQPCVEHTGTGCSIVNGTAIGNVTQVVDANTRAGEVALGSLGVDTQRADAIVLQLETRKAEIERERSELETAGQQANTMAKRRAVIARQRAIARRYARLGDELTALAAELDRLGDTAQVAVAPLSAALQIPYADPSGYCACYRAKLAQLQALATQITAELATMAAANAAYNAARAAAIPKLRLTFTLAAGVFIALFILLGVPAGLVLAAFIALLFTAVTVLGLAVQLGMRRSALLRSRAALYALWLDYYRIQTIPTCQRSVGSKKEDGKSADEKSDGPRQVRSVA